VQYGVKTDNFVDKENSMSEAQRAVDKFKAGCACSQAVFASYSPKYQLSTDNALKISSGFAGGMRTGDTCGAVTGAYMVLGLAKAGADCDSMQGRQRVYAAIMDFNAHFKEKNKSLICRELLGCDMGTPQGKKEAEEKGLFTTLCPKFVEDAALILEQILQ
jgi:C_GCAxxG_C_C family probable redox protein